MKTLTPTLGYWLKKLGIHRGAPRLWFETLRVGSAGLVPGSRFDVVALQHGIKLVSNADGQYVVCSKVRNGRCLPVIDINNREVLSPLGGQEVVRVIVRADGIFVLRAASEQAKAERIERLRGKLAAGEQLASTSIAHGAGVLSNAAHTGFSDAGIELDMKVLCEIDAGYVEQSLSCNPVSAKTVPLCAPIQELVQDEWLMRQVPRVEVLEMGLPCSGASRAGKAKRGLSMMEEHPEVGHLIFAALALIQKLQPAAIVLENVEDYRDSASAQILRSQLRDMGYQVREHVLRARDFGSLENRVRWALVATTDGLLPLDSVPMDKVPDGMRLGALLEDIEPDAACWSTMGYLKEKATRDKLEGKGFAMQLVNALSTSVPTIRKSYNKGGSTDPFVLHPTDPERMRKLTPAEHARIKGVPLGLVHGLSATTAHEVLGQGIAYAPFRALFRELAGAFKRLRDLGPCWMGECATANRLSGTIG
jgi:DNA (cytosine-5)-methyltransferase 1